MSSESWKLGGATTSGSKAPLEVEDFEKGSSWDLVGCKTSSVMGKFSYPPTEMDRTGGLSGFSSYGTDVTGKYKVHGSCLDYSMS